VATTDLAGLRVLVTGASSGIGAAIAKELHARGAKLVLTARRRDKLDALAAELGGAEVIVGDLGQPGGAASVWAAAAQTGPIDVLINNAGFVEKPTCTMATEPSACLLSTSRKRATASGASSPLFKSCG